MEPLFYLFTSSGIQDESSETVFYQVKGELLAKSLCELFTREYSDTDGWPAFHHKAIGSISVAEQVLLDESLDYLAVYDDPDPGIYDPPPSKHTMTLAEYALRAKKWEQLLRERPEVIEPNGTDDSGSAPTNAPTDELPEMPAEDRRNSGLILLMLLAQAYYKMLECTISMASWCASLDLQLNESYLWTVKSITNLLKNHEDLRDFPKEFKPLFHDLYPSTIRDLDWEDMVAPDAEEFLSTVQQYVHSKGIYDPEEGSAGWVFIELYRPAVNIAIERAIKYNKQMNQYCQRILGSSPSVSSIIESEQTMKKTVVELDLVGYSTIGDTFEQGLDVSTVAQLNRQIQSFIEIGLKAANTTREESAMSNTGDGAILVFDSAQDAHRFAEAVHEATRQHNRIRKQDLAMRVFRSGAASGEIVMKPKPGGGYDIAGSTIARAVRLEAKALPGGFLIDKATFDALPPERRHQYGAKQIVRGKRDEEFEAYPAQLNVDGPSDVAFFTREPKMSPATGEVTGEFGSNKRREVLAYFNGLKSHQYVELIFLLEIPIGQRPAETLNLDQQKAQVLKWADENDKLDSVLQVLRELTES
jgi:class 3 adenylate cyclase